MSYPESLKNILNEIKKSANDDELADKLWELKVWWDDNKPEFNLETIDIDTLVNYTKEDQHIFKAESAYYAMAAVNPKWIDENKEEIFNHPLWNVRLAAYEALITLHPEEKYDLLQKIYSEEEIQVKWFITLYLVQETESIDPVFFGKLLRGENEENKIIGSFIYAFLTPEKEMDNLKKLCLKGLIEDDDLRISCLYAINFIYNIEKGPVLDFIFEFYNEIPKYIPEYNLFHIPSFIDHIKENFRVEFLKRIPLIGEERVAELYDIFTETDAKEIKTLKDKSELKEEYWKIYENILSNIKKEENTISKSGIELDI